MNLIVDNLMHLTITDIIDIAIIAFLFYSFMLLVKETRAEQLIKGLIFIVIFWRLSEWAGLRMVNFLIKNMMTLGLVALIIVFQPELRRALEYIGRSRILTSKGRDVLQEDTERMIDAVVDAVIQLSKNKTGALIALERETGLSDVIKAGTALDASVSSQLIKSIFNPSSPLHDGAIVIKNNRISRAATILPLTLDDNLSTDLGTRHRAAMGLLERSDAVVIIVSEETGTISIAIDDKLMRYLDANSLSSVLRTKFKVVAYDSLLSWIKGSFKHEEN